MNIYHIKRSKLAENITFENFRSDGILMQNPDYDYINKIIGIPGPSEETSYFSTLEYAVESEKPMSDYLDFCKGHWIDKIFYNQIEIILKEYDLVDRTDSICMALLVQKQKKKLLSEEFPKQGKSHLTNIYDFFNKMKSIGQPTIKLMKSGGREVMTLSKDESLRLKLILFGWYFDSPEGKKDLEDAMKYDQEEAEFYAVCRKLKHRTNTYRLLLTHSIKSMYILFSEKVPAVTERHFLIGKLLYTCELFKCNLSEKSKKEQKAYFHNRLKSFTKGLR